MVDKSKIFRSRNIVGSEFSFFSIIISFDLCHLFVVILMRGHPYITSRRFSHNLRDFQGGWSENYFNITHSLSLLAFTEIPSEETGGALAWIQCAATSCGKNSKKQIYGTTFCQNLISGWLIRLTMQIASSEALTADLFQQETNLVVQSKNSVEPTVQSDIWTTGRSRYSVLPDHQSAQANVVMIALLVISIVIYSVMRRRLVS